MRKKSLDRPQGCGKVEIGCRQDSKNICTLPEIDFYGSNVTAMWHRKFKSAVRDLRLRQFSTTVLFYDRLLRANTIEFIDHENIKWKSDY